MEILNTIALQTSTDEKHRIYFARNGETVSLSLAELDRRAVRVAQHLQAMCIKKGDRVAVMARNCIEWALLDLAVLKLGGVAGGFDPAKFDPAVAMQRYGIRLLVVEKESGLPDSVSLADIWDWACSDAAMPPLRLHAGYQPMDPVAIKFTSGSTGAPKGMLAMAGGVNDSLCDIQEMFGHGDHDNILIFLRLNYPQQRYWIYSGMAFGHDITLTDLDSALSMAQACHPTVIMGVPGFFDMVKRGLEATCGDQLDDPGVRREKIQAALGGRIRYLWTGSAPAGRATLDFYDACGVPIYQGYGLNETCIVAKNCPGANRTGSVGRVLPNKSVRFDANGVIVVRSRNPIVQNYSWCKPGDNPRMFLPTGEVFTNDVGYLDADGYLYIQGRVDDTIVLSTGLNIVVDQVEECLKANRDIHQCILYGHGRPFLTAVISPISDLIGRDQVSQHIDTVNATLFPEQRIRGFVISPEPFSIDNGLLTTQFKPFRKKIHERFEGELDAVYQQATQGALWKGTHERWNF